MKSLTLLAQKITLDLGDRVGISTIRDRKTITERVENEGMSFLTITLAQFCKDFERSLDRGYVDHDLFKHFAFTGSCPRFCGGFFDLIFNRCDGILLDNPSIEAIQAIRQLTGMWSKIKMECSDERNHSAFLEYLNSEEAVKLGDRLRSDQDYLDFERIASLLFRDIFIAADKAVYEGKILPKHGPGSTADGTLGNKKYQKHVWTDRLEYLFPAREYLFTMYCHSFEHDVTWLAPGQEPPVKVITVPKTLKTPRIIAMEPVHTQYVQQGILELFYEKCSKSNFLRMFISFDDQEPNRYLAHEGSLYGDLATLDLSAASDLVSNQLVRCLFGRYGSLLEAVQSSRSQSAVVLGKTIRLAKFASMGSALCFPVEAFVFLTLIFLGIERAVGRRLTIKDIESFDGSVRAFGDDLIVPVSYVHEVISVLESFGLKVNRDKSFWTGRFRESCGKEYYAGHDVSIVKLRSLLPSRPTHVDEIVSTVAFRNLAQNQCLFRAVAEVDLLIEGLIPFPEVQSTSSVLGRHVIFGSPKTQRWDRHLQRPLVKGVRVDAPLPSDKLDSHAALLKFFLKRGLKPMPKRHLERAGRPSTVKLKAGWFCSY